LTAIFKRIRPVGVALILAPVCTTAKASGIGWKLCWIPAAVALLIWSKLPVVSNPILFVILGGLVGYILTRRSHSKLTERREGSDK
ncbi:MAG: chromate transporter, partial [Muribaculaceae bacterium]|nr:chromate transporter [Muribaculaceae bacterium]